MNFPSLLRNRFPTKEDHIRLWRIAGPMTLMGLASPLLGMVDTIVMGHLEAAYYLGAVAVGSTLAQLLFWGAGFLCMSSTALAAQVSHDSRKTRLVLIWGILSATFISLLVLLIRGPLQHFAYASRVADYSGLLLGGLTCDRANRQPLPSQLMNHDDVPQLAIWYLLLRMASDGYSGRFPVPGTCPLELNVNLQNWPFLLWHNWVLLTRY